jgi:hypothetical protein
MNCWTSPCRLARGWSATVTAIAKSMISERRLDNWLINSYNRPPDFPKVALSIMRYKELRAIVRVSLVDFRPCVLLLASVRLDIRFDIVPSQRLRVKTPCVKNGPTSGACILCAGENETHSLEWRLIFENTASMLFVTVSSSYQLNVQIWDYIPSHFSPYLLIISNWRQWRAISIYSAHLLICHSIGYVTFTLESNLKIWPLI